MWHCTALTTWYLVDIHNGLTSTIHGSTVLKWEINDLIWDFWASQPIQFVFLIFTFTYFLPTNICKVLHTHSFPISEILLRNVRSFLNFLPRQRDCDSWRLLRPWFQWTAGRQGWRCTLHALSPGHQYLAEEGCRHDNQMNCHLMLSAVHFYTNEPNYKSIKN